MDDLQNFRQLHSKTPGHPEYNKNLGIEVSTGPLGQGIANGVGMAIASKKMGLDNQIYVMCGDGCLMEGISYESASLAGHLGLNNLILLYDDNGITIDGKTDITFTENVRGRFIALNWNVLEVLDGDNDVNDIYDKITMAKNSTDKPTIIFVKTIIGYGSVVAGTSACHGAPLGNIKTQLLKEHFGFDKENTFFIDEDVKDFFNLLKHDKIKYYTEQPEIDVCVEDDISMVVSQLRQIHNQEKNYATRESSSIVLKQIVSSLQNVIVGSADLAESNKTWVSPGFITKHDFSQKYLHYGIREHSMAAIANGISTYDIIPIVSTFFVFITYCLAPIRMAAISRHKVIYVLTHDSVFLGEDGPTHQPVESLTVLRSIPDLLTIRPCDTTEVSGAYQIALTHNGPCALILSRQTLTNLENSNMDKMTKGAYVVYEPTNIQFIIVATGSEVSLAIEVAEHMGNIRVVSMPCCELFDLQNILYKDEIMPANIKKMSLEAGATLGWYKYVDYAYGIDSFGASGTMLDIKTYFGFTKSNIINYLVKTVKYCGNI